MQEAGELAKNTSILMNVSEFDDVNKATDTLISSLQAFKKEGQDVGTFSMEIIDKYNEVGNNYAISTSDLADSLTRSSAALVAANNSLEQSIAMTAAANTTIQDPESVGNALKTVSMRIRGVKTELEEAGEDTEGMVTNTAKLQEKIMALTNIDGSGGIDILTESGDFKSTYDILLAISKVWKEMDDTSQAALLELVAGKTRGSVVAALFQNGDVLEDAYKSAASASGSAMNELNTYLDSVQGRIDIFNNSLQTMWMNTIDSDAVKIIVDIGTEVIKLVDALGLIPTAIGAFSAFKIAANDVKSNLDIVNKAIQDTIMAKQAEAVATETATAATEADSVAEEFNTAMKNANAAAGWKDVVATNAEVVATKALAVAKGILTGVAKGVVIMLASQVIGKAFEWIYESIDKAVHHAEYLKEEITELKNTYKETKKTFSDNLTELTTSSDTNLYATLEDEFKRLTQGVDEYGNNLSLTTDQYERYKEICEQIVGINPSIAAGYDSATRAIGNNASALSKLIELQEKQAKQAASDLLTDENLDKVAEDALNDVHTTNTDGSSALSSAYGKFSSVLSKAVSTEMNDYLGNNLNTNASTNDDRMRFILEKIGYKETTGIVQSYWNQALGDYNFNQFMIDYLDEIRDNTDKFGLDYQVLLDDAIYQIDQQQDQYKENLLKSRDGLISTLLEVPYSKEGAVYDNLNAASQNSIIEWIKNAEVFKIDPNATTEEVQEQIKENKQLIIDLINDFNNGTIQGALSDIDEIDTSSLTNTEYYSLLSDYYGSIWQELGGVGNKYGWGTVSDLENAFGFDRNAELKLMDDARTSITGYLEKSISATKDDVTEFINNLSRDEFEALININWDVIGSDGVQSFADVLDIINSNLHNLDKIASHTYSTLKESVSSYQDVLSQTSEIVSDNTQVTQEYKDALISLGVSEDELNECFDENNELVVKDARALNNLVKSAKKNTAQNIKLAKSQARLEYYELYKEMKQLTNGTQVTDKATLDYINSLYQQMNVLQRTIAKYSLLEAELLGAANAYQELVDAQAADEAMDYGSKAEELVNVLAEAFNTAQLGTESARVAIEGLIPDDVIDKSKTLDEQMQQVYDYFTNGPVSQLFTIEFDEEGAIQSVEMTKENVQAFTESLIGTDEDSVFQGTWDEFTLNPAIKTLEDFADAIGATKEVAFAYLTEMEKYDIGNVLGGGDSLLDQLMGDNLDHQLQKAIETAAEVEKKLAEGELSASSKEYQDAQKNLEAREERAIDDVTTWSKKQQALEEQKKTLVELQKQYEETYKAGGDTSQIEQAIEDTSAEIDTLIGDLRELDEPTEFVLEVAMSEAQENIAEFKENINELVESGDEKAIKINSFVEKIDTTGLDDLESLGFVKGSDGVWRGTANIEGWSELDPASKQKVLEYINMIEKEHQIDLALGEDTPTIEDHLKTISETLERIANLLDPTYTLSVITSGAQEKIDTFKSVWDTITSKEITLTQKIKTITQQIFGNEDEEVDAVSSVNGTANAGGSWGAPKTETSLVGELGPEILVRGNRWTTVGDNGAEFTQVKKGDIIFNHKQTEELLKNGHVTGRGKAYAGGTAYAMMDKVMSFTKDGGRIDTWDNAYQTVYNDYSNATIVEDGGSVNTYDGGTDIATDYGNIGDDAEDIFEETFDWIEVRLEEWDELLGKLNAQLENAVYYTEKNNKINEIIATNQGKLVDLQAGADYYEKHAQKYLDQLSETYKTYAKNGAIYIEDFVGDADEATLEAIQNYRDYIQKAADLNQQAEEVITTIRDLAIQRVDNAYEHGSVRATVESSQTEKLQNAVDFDETRGLITNPEYYAAMMENSSKTIEYLTYSRDAMQKELDLAVKNGEITKGSNEWYELIDQMYQVQSEIDQAKIELEEFQNSINDIYWESFDELINRMDYISEETQGLIGLMDELDMVSKPDNEDGWGASDVEWTKEGIATLALHAQEMERAEEKAKAYAVAINDLTIEYEAGHYSESEYYEKLNELTQGQYDAIEAAQEEKEAIVELNEQRVDAIKEGIEKQIEAYEELIKAKQDELSAEKDLYDFQRSTMEQQKDIAEIERRLAALANDNSMSAIAQRKQLEAELAEAQYELENTYYDRSVEDKQTALDKELENFQTQKEAEIEKWEEYLTNVETVVAESLGIVKENATAVYDILKEKATEYNLTLDPAITAPWVNGVDAIDTYTTKFGDAVSSTTEQLEAIRSKWQEIKEVLSEANAEADKYYSKADAQASGSSVAEINKSNADYASATKTIEPAKPEQPANPSGQTVPSLANGSSIVVKKSATHFGSKSGGVAMASFVPGGTYTVYQTSGDQVLIGRNGVYTGWVKKTDIQGFASGTTGVKKDQLAWIDEMGLEELVMHAGPNGRLQYLTKGSSVIPHDITENLMQLGQLDPSEVLKRSTPQIGMSPSVVNNEVNITMEIAEVVHIDHVDHDALPDLTKAVRKEMDSYMLKVNNAIKSKVR